ncbi:hypothetical protein SAMN02745133_01960 [Desulforamulus putei DSM 12395]|uniref:AAA+ ATPase domain-containing protein n=1 Tax=Desulforamulus putei DSM 12395 TaxID=1121429 RepID=A0A1M4ZD27_9FIRM|nr:AAA family ATPase [Desulforamulus putei]SHF15940.1 hypothetical protein SAMN02745133_01960 [Desulforamulus putei DSM 12395]
MEFRPAKRSNAFIKLGISGPSGSGKTASSLLMAYGLVKDWGLIGIADTENRSGELYVGAEINGVRIGQYLTCEITPPFTPEKYIQAIEMAERSGLKALIIDSLTHAWAGQGGLLDIHGGIVDRGEVNNSWAAWRKVTPQHNALVDAMLQSKLHILATIRAKTEYVQTVDDRGKTVIRKVGMAPIQRDGMEYEFTVFLDIDHDHMARASKDRTNTLDGRYFKPSVQTGQILLDWLNAGGVPIDPPEPEPKPEAKLESKPEPPKTDPKPQVEVYEGVVTIAAAPEKHGEKRVYYTVTVTSEDGKVDGLVGDEKLSSFAEGEKYKIKGQFKEGKVKVAQFEKIEVEPQLPGTPDETLTPPAEWLNDGKEAGTYAGITITFAGEDEGEPYTGMVAITDPVEGGFKGFDVATDNLLTIVGNIEGLKPGEGVEITGKIKDGIVTVESYKSFGSPAEEPPKADEEPTYTLKVASLPAEGSAEENGKLLKVHWFWAFVGENKGVVAVDQESGLKLPPVKENDILVVTGNVQQFKGSNVLFITGIKSHNKSAV